MDMWKDITTLNLIGATTWVVLRWVSGAPPVAWLIDVNQGSANRADLLWACGYVAAYIITKGGAS